MEYDMDMKVITPTSFSGNWLLTHTLNFSLAERALNNWS